MDSCISEGITDAYFYVPAHKILWNCLWARHEKGKAIDSTSVAQELTDHHQLEAVGGYAGLNEFFAFTSTAALFPAHLEILREKYTLRSIYQTCTNAAARACSGEEDAETQLDQVEQSVLQIRQGATKAEAWSIGEDLRQVTADLERMMKNGGEIIGLSTGLPVLDRLTNGLKSGELFVIAARPAMGKTSLLLNIAEHIVFDLKKPMAVFSLEMTSIQLLHRLLYTRSGVNATRALRQGGKLTEAELSHLKKALHEIKNCGLIIEGKSALTLSDIRARARRILREHPDLAAIGIDYLQLMRSHSKQAQNSREREVSEISAGLKNLAKELQLPIITLAQLNRGSENRPDKRPQLHDLRDSGSIEQDADFVGLLHRPSKYDPEAPHDFLCLDKNRNGETADIPLTFRADLTRFEPA